MFRDMNLSRREMLRYLGGIALASAYATPLSLLSACRHNKSDVAPEDPNSPGNTPVSRLQYALRNTAALSRATNSITVTQGPAQSADPAIGSSAVIYPLPRGYGVNPNPVTLASMPQVWGHRRATWKESTIGYIGSSIGNGSWYVPIGQWHRAASLTAYSACGLHFIFDGQAFEILFAGTNVRVTLVADGQYMAPRFITTEINAGVTGTPLAAHNAYVRFDFGTRATRRISFYGSSSQGPCAIAIGNMDRIVPWDRSSEPSFCAMTDSYGQPDAENWGWGGPFWEAASLLGIPHLDLNAIGGTGYAPNTGSIDRQNPGNAFIARINTGVVSRPDLFMTAGGINDNNSLAAPPLYATPEQARLGFETAVNTYFRDLRAALPGSVLVAMGPWAPVESIPVNAVARSKADAIRSAMQTIGGPWIFLDNLNGSWINSSGIRTPAAGSGWQTGTGNVGNPRGDGNGDLYVAADGAHPTAAGCLYLGQVIAAQLRDALLAL